MGLFDKVKQGLKDATGLGLDLQEQYQRAYAKGVFIQDLDSAVKNFEKAAEKCREAGGDPAFASRARANAALYRLLQSRDRARIPSLLEALREVPELEQIGTDQETVETGPWVTELKALQLEHSAEGEQDFTARKLAYGQASDLLMSMGDKDLTFAEKLGFKGPRERATLRAFYCGAQADYNAAFVNMLSSPARAEDEFHKAKLKFRHAQEAEWDERVDGMIEKIQSRRHCYMCGREMQGRTVFFDYYPARVEPYNRTVLEGANHDVAMLDTEDHVTLCTVCGSAIERQADRYATQRTAELKAWVEPILERHQEWLNNHERRVSRLEDQAHRH